MIKKLILPLLLLSLVACYFPTANQTNNNDIDNSNDSVISQNSNDINLRFEIPENSNFAKSAQSVLAFAISGNDTLSTSNLKIIGNSVIGNLSKIKVGKNRIIKVVAYDSNQNPIYSGSVITDIIAGEVVIVKITLTPVTGTVLIYGEINDGCDPSKGMYDNKNLKEYFFQMKWYNAAGIGEIYANNKKIDEYYGYYPKTNGEISLGRFSSVKDLKLSIKTYWHEKWYGPEYDTDKKFFNVSYGKDTTTYTFGGAEAFDSGYNDGQFIIYTK